MLLSISEKKIIDEDVQKSQLIATQSSQNITEHYPSARWGHTLSRISEDEVLLIGGEAEKKIKDNIWLLDLENAAWVVPDINYVGQRPERRSGHTACFDPLLRCLYLFGGYRNCQCLSEMHILDIDEMKWRACECLDTVPCLAYHSAIFVDGNMFVFGGQSSSKKYKEITCSNTLYKYSSVDDRWTSPSTFGKPPASRSGHSASLLIDKMVIFGGWDGSTYFNDVHVLDIQSLQWNCIQLTGSELEPRSWHASTTLWGNRVLVQGGWNGVQALNDIHVLNFDTMSSVSIKLEPSIDGRLGHAMLCLPFNHDNDNKDQVLMFGGGNNSNTFFCNLINLMIPINNSMLPS